MPLTLTEIHALLPDNTAGDISAQDMRDVSTALHGRYAVDTAFGKAYTLSHTPHGNYTGNFYAVQGVSNTNGALTAPMSGLIATSEAFGQTRNLGWRCTGSGEIQSGDLIVTFDYGAGVTVEVSRGVVVGGWNTSQQVFHPAGGKLEYSDNGSSWTTFGSALSGLGSNPGTRNIGRWAMYFEATPVDHRYWRFSVVVPSGTGDNWLMVEQVQLLGTIL